MRSIKFIVILITYLISYSSVLAFSPDWGATGHRTIGEIAEGYLKNKTKRQISKLLDGKSLALVSTFGDDIKSDKRYNEFYTWHFINMPFDVSYEKSEKNQQGDLVTGIKKCISVISDSNATKADKAFYLKLLVHLIGDLHQPMHVGRKEDKGGNDIQVQWFNRGTNLHRVWDSDMINHFNMTYTELAENSNKITKEQVRFLQKGSVFDWAHETQAYAVKAYASVKIGEKLGYKYMYDNFEIVRTQLQKGGIRLAKILNDLFA
jgi:hypothetical protein